MQTRHLRSYQTDNSPISQQKYGHRQPKGCAGLADVPVAQITSPCVLSLFNNSTQIAGHSVRMNQRGFLATHLSRGGGSAQCLPNQFMTLRAKVFANFLLYKFLLNKLLLDRILLHRQHALKQRLNFDGTTDPLCRSH